MAQFFCDAQLPNHSLGSTQWIPNPLQQPNTALFQKIKGGVIASVSYDARDTAACTLSNTILLFTENGVDEVASSDYRAHPDIRHVPSLEKSVHKRSGEASQIISNQI